MSDLIGDKAHDTRLRVLHLAVPGRRFHMSDVGAALDTADRGALWNTVAGLVGQHILEREYEAREREVGRFVYWRPA